MNFLVSSDLNSAYLRSGNTEFFFSFSDENDHHFVVKSHGIEVFEVSAKELSRLYNTNMLHQPKDYLLAGIGYYLMFK